MEVLTRQARKADVDAIFELIASFAARKMLLSRTKEDIASRIKTFRVVEANGKVVGCAALEIYSKKLAEMRSLAVSDAHQGLGVGSALVKKIVEDAGKAGVLELMVVTSKDEFFCKHGFSFTLPSERKALFIDPQAAGKA